MVLKCILTDEENEEDEEDDKNEENKSNYVLGIVLPVSAVLLSAALVTAGRQYYKSHRRHQRRVRPRVNSNES